MLDDMRARLEEARRQRASSDNEGGSTGHGNGGGSTGGGRGNKGGSTGKGNGGGSTDNGHGNGGGSTDNGHGNGGGSTDNGHGNGGGSTDNGHGNGGGSTDNGNSNGGGSTGGGHCDHHERIIIIAQSDKQVQASLGSEPSEEFREFIKKTVRECLQDEYRLSMENMKSYVGDVLTRVAQNSFAARVVQQPTSSTAGTANPGASGTTGAEETLLEKNRRLLLAFKVDLPLRTKRSLCNLNTLLTGSDGLKVETILVDFLVAVAEVLTVNT
jgi:hypothetical protein